MKFRLSVRLDVDIRSFGSELAVCLREQDIRVRCTCVSPHRRTCADSVNNDDGSIRC